MAVVEIVSERKSRFEEEANQVREHMSDQCNTAIHEMGDDIAGYAFVVWNRVGEMKSMYNTSYGPIRSQIMPAIVADALNRQLTIMMTKAEFEKDRR